MKKIFTMLVCLGTLTTLSAQYNNHSSQSNGRNVADHDRNYGQPSHDNNATNNSYGYGDHQQNNSNIGNHDRDHAQPNYDYGSNGGRYTQQDDRRENRRYNDNQRREEMDRVNRDYERRINNYRYDRSLNNYERNRRIQEMQRERNTKLKSFGAGAIVGGILGVILGSHL